MAFLEAQAFQLRDQAEELTLGRFQLSKHNVLLAQKSVEFLCGGSHDSKSAGRCDGTVRLRSMRLIVEEWRFECRRGTAGY